jgi:dipeptidyl aminopeptidase/acylaminoacyl peptidase
MKKTLFSIVLVLAVSFHAAAQGYTIQQYLNIKSASAPSLSPDGRKLAYLTNATGTSQIWMVDLPKGAPKQMTNYEDNVGFVIWSPKGDGLVFGKARGGDENTQFFWMSPDGEVRQLTNDPKVRHNFGDWSEDGSRIFYASNRRDRNFFDIYSMDLVTGSETMLYQQNGSVSFTAISKDGAKIVVSKASDKFSLDNDLYLIDVKTNEVKHITPHEGPSQYTDVHFLKDGTLLLGTNEDKEFINLATLTVGSRNRMAPLRYVTDFDWDLDATALSDDESTLAYTLNREGFSELYIKPTMSAAKGTPVRLPGQGIVGGLRFSKDKKRLVFSFASSRHNSDVWLFDRTSNKLTQVTKSDRAGVAQTSFIAPTLIRYKTFDGRDIPAWFYRPKGARDGSTPVIVSVHGGPEGQERPGFNALYQYYLSRGYAVLATNVRGSTGYGKTFTHLDDVKLREDSVKDLAYSVLWLRSEGGADAKRIAVMGGSYGGYMTMAAVTLYPDFWAAAVNTVGIVNWETFLQNTSGYRRRQREVEYGFLDRDIEFLREISPIRKIDRIKAPLFVIHGKNDPRVPYTEAEQVVKALRDRGATVEYKLFDDEGHGVSKLKNRLELFPLVADFLDRNMGKK